jgi:hypothetical protein
VPLEEWSVTPFALGSIAWAFACNGDVRLQLHAATLKETKSARKVEGISFHSPICCQMICRNSVDRGLKLPRELPDHAGTRLQIDQPGWIP